MQFCGGRADVTTTELRRKEENILNFLKKYSAYTYINKKEEIINSMIHDTMMIQDTYDQGWAKN
jgi:hypothetical protein